MTICEGVPGATPSRSHQTVTPHGTPTFCASEAAIPPFLAPLAALGFQAVSDSTYCTSISPIPTLRRDRVSFALSAEACGLSRRTYRTANLYPRRRNAAAAFALTVSAVSNPRAPSGAVQTWPGRVIRQSHCE